MTAQRGHFDRPVSAEPTSTDRERADQMLSREAALEDLDMVAGLLAEKRAAIAAAREEGRQEGERIRAAEVSVVVAALVARAELAEAALRRVEVVVQTFDIAQPRIAADLRAAVAPAQPAEGCYCDSDLVPVPHAEHLPAQPVTRITPTEEPDHA